jgi:hypothetical protein
VATGDNIALHVADGDRLLGAVYGRLPELLSDGGRAVFHHQIRLDPPEHFAQRVSNVDGDGDLSVTWVETTRRPVDPFGVSLVRRRRAGEKGPAVRLVRHPLSSVLELDRGRVDLLAATQDVLSRGGPALLAAVPALLPGAPVTRAYAVDANGRLGPSDAVQVGIYPLDAQVLELLESCDGRTVGQLAEEYEDPDDLTGAVSQLAARGILVLREA